MKRHRTHAMKPSAADELTMDHFGKVRATACGVYIMWRHGRWWRNEEVAVVIADDPTCRNCQRARSAKEGRHGLLH